MYNRNVEPSDTNCPIAFFVPYGIVMLKRNFFSLFQCQLPKRYLGGYSDRVPPLPIPNREVKPVHVDGTAAKWESR